MKTTVLGEGGLGWHSHERHTNRYGAVHLNTQTAADPAFVDFFGIPTGRVGALVAVVLGVHTRGSNAPRVGQVIRLGYGELFREEMNPELRVVGVRPKNRFRKPWLNFDNLTTCQYQRVRLELRA